MGKYTWLGIGVAVGYFVVPMALGTVFGLFSKAKGAGPGPQGPLGNPYNRNMGQPLHLNRR